MLHELLLALAGNPSPLLQSTLVADAAGGAKTESRSTNNGNGTLLTPPERALLARAARLSQLHSSLLAACAELSSSSPHSVQGGPEGAGGRNTTATSPVVRAVAAAIASGPLASFHAAVLRVEEGILRRDAAFVGGCDVVPLTQVVCELETGSVGGGDGEEHGWARRLEWLWDTVGFITGRGRHRERGGGSKTRPHGSRYCTGAELIDYLRAEARGTGYRDIEATALELGKVAEATWLRMVVGWVLYGRLPGLSGSSGDDDFFIKRKRRKATAAKQGHGGTAAVADEEDQYDFVVDTSLLPSFVTPATAASMLFVGRSLNQIRARAGSTSYISDAAGSLSVAGGVAGNRNLATAVVQGPGLAENEHLSSQLAAFSRLTYPLASGPLSRTVSGARLALSRGTLRRLLPLSRVTEILALLRDYMLLGRGEFVTALVRAADDTMQERWRRAERLEMERRQKQVRQQSGKKHRGGGGADDGLLAGVVVKEGEVAAVLARTWQALGAARSGGRAAHASLENDTEEAAEEALERARSLLRLSISKQTKAPLKKSSSALSPSAIEAAADPFCPFLLSVPTTLHLASIPSPLDLFLSPRDVDVYSALHAYLLAIRRARIRLTDLWRVSSLRRDPTSSSWRLAASGRMQRGASGAGAAARARAARNAVLRDRALRRAEVMRSAWATGSAAAFFLSETEAYFQVEVIGELWEGLLEWLHAPDKAAAAAATAATSNGVDRGTPKDFDHGRRDEDDDKDADEDDIWLAEASTSAPKTPEKTSIPSARSPDAKQRANDTTHLPPPHDPQTLQSAHRLYLATLSRHLLLLPPPPSSTTATSSSSPAASFTAPLPSLLHDLDALSSLVRRLDAAWRSADLEADEGVVDAFVGDAEAEATMLASELRRVERRVRKGIARCVEALKAIEGAVYDDHVVLGRSDAGVDLGSLLETARRGSGVRLDEHKEEEGGEGSDDDNAIDEDWDVDVLALLDAAAYYDDANDHGSSGGGIRYAPRRTGGVDRLLTKLDFGHWLDDGDDHSLDDEG